MKSIVLQNSSDVYRGTLNWKGLVNTKRAVLIDNLMTDWNALKLWSVDYFQKINPSPNVSVKLGDVSKGVRRQMKLDDYVQYLRRYENRPVKDVEIPPYLHDFPIFHITPHLLDDIQPFPKELFPAFYHPDFQNYAQFFMSGTGSITPLHFDTLGTHNLFFQVSGQKQFTLIEPQDCDKCYLHSWRWAEVNPKKPDFVSFPKFKDVVTKEIVVGPGQALYIPPFTLHHVETLSCSISFNIDWHTSKSVLKALVRSVPKAPAENLYYNFLIATGLLFQLPPRLLFPLYKSYLNYLS